jgi:Nuclear fragile X mental retardation-interacting protein 1 (NUFIP1)/CCCH-type zinc finger
MKNLGESPEDMEAWIEDRRRRFPTKNRIEKRISEPAVEQLPMTEFEVNPKTIIKPDTNETNENVRNQFHKKVCNIFMKGITCKFGDSCKYSHDYEMKEKMLLKRREAIVLLFHYIVEIRVHFKPRGLEEYNLEL